MSDARFEDGDERPLRLLAQDSEDLKVISTLVQDAVLTGADIAWSARQRRLGLLLNRFRWEDRDAAGGIGRPPERVRSLLEIGDALRVRTQDLPRGDGDTVLSLLALSFEAGPDGTGQVMLAFAGDAMLAVEVECLDIRLTDVTRPYLAPSRTVPQHRD